MTESIVTKLGFIWTRNDMGYKLWKVGTSKTERKYFVLGHFKFGYESLTGGFIINNTVCIIKSKIIWF